jgi:hypothetical protein
MKQLNVVDASEQDVPVQLPLMARTLRDSFPERALGLPALV